MDIIYELTPADIKKLIVEYFKSRGYDDPNVYTLSDGSVRVEMLDINWDELEI